MLFPQSLKYQKLHCTGRFAVHPDQDTRDHRYEDTNQKTLYEYSETRNDSSFLVTTTTVINDVCTKPEHHYLLKAFFHQNLTHINGVGHKHSRRIPKVFVNKIVKTFSVTTKQIYIRYLKQKNKTKTFLPLFFASTLFQ